MSKSGVGPGSETESGAMSEVLPSEFVVRFARGIPEAEARTLIEAAGGTIRRRMRWDPPEEVLLLVRLPAAQATKLQRESRVAHLEANDDGYRPMS
ncbi:MAG: hypothetical protein IPK13_05890 [Deltaproteobacteria bacterium]|nr:hypothetical protein [Deltaproteobacteria bacterium]